MDASIRLIYTGRKDNKLSARNIYVPGLFLEVIYRKFNILAFYLPLPFSGDSKGKGLSRYYERVSGWCFEDTIIQHYLISSL